MIVDLKQTIIKDCKTWEKLNDNGFIEYMYLNECENDLYQLILNGDELWYGTLAEINAVVKSMIYRLEGRCSIDKVDVVEFV